MSWAAHNPELYDDLIRKGILHWVDNLMDKAGFEVPGEWREGYEALVEVLQIEPSVHHIYEELLHLASKDIVHAEQDYFGGLIDHAMNTNQKGEAG